LLPSSASQTMRSSLRSTLRQPDGYRIELIDRSGA
jgi:hypothetical protein